MTKLKLDTVEIIKLKIIKCSIPNGWYSDRINQKIDFFNFIFRDDGREHKESLYTASLPTRKYAYLDDTNYYSYIRSQKLKKINDKV
jgi:hypothetical protein